MLLVQLTLAAFSRARLKAGSNRLARMPMMAMTTSNSIKVNRTALVVILRRLNGFVAIAGVATNVSIRVKPLLELGFPKTTFDVERDSRGALKAAPSHASKPTGAGGNPVEFRIIFTM
jgi:hypothetical protein